MTTNRLILSPNNSDDAVQKTTFYEFINSGFSIKRLFVGLVVLFSLMAKSADGAAVDLENASRAAEKQLQQHVALYGHWGNVAAPQLARMQTVQWNGDPLAYHFEVRPCGFILVAVDDVFSPVLMYSTSASFDLGRVNDPDAVESWIVPELDHRVRKWRAGQRPAAAEAGSGPENGSAVRIRKAWKHIYRTPAEVSGNRSQTARLTDADEWDRTAVKVAGPLLTSQWGQDAPYNTLAPDDDCAGGHTLAGCVAVAWAQLLRYWRWPDKPEGSHAYDWSDQSLTVNFDAASRYNWDLMPNVLGADSSQIQIDAVARLIYDVALAADTDFACSVSSSVRFADKILERYFKYSSDMRYHDRTADAYTPEQWFALIKTELDADPPRPVVLSIWGTHGGHEVIADGYQSGDTDLIHINFGWEGNLNFFYNISDDFVTSGIVWSANTQVIVTGIQPDYTRASSTDSDEGDGACFIRALFGQ